MCHKTPFFLWFLPFILEGLDTSSSTVTNLRWCMMAVPPHYFMTSVFQCDLSTNITLTGFTIFNCSSTTSNWGGTMASVPQFVCTAASWSVVTATLPRGHGVCDHITGRRIDWRNNVFIKKDKICHANQCILHAKNGQTHLKKCRGKTCYSV